MSLVLSIGLCILLPAIFLGIFCIAVPEFKFRWGLWSAVTGLFSLIPITFIQFFILSLPIFTAQTIGAVLVTAIIFNGLIEETVKMLCMLLLPYKKQSFPAFFCQTLICGLSLGCFETIIYLFAGFQEIGLRLVTAVVIHTFCAGLSGCYLWSFRKKSPRTMPFVYAAALHGVYNFFAGFTGFFWWFSVLAILLTLLECRIWYQKIMLPPATAKSPRAEGTSRSEKRKQRTFPEPAQKSRNTTVHATPEKSKPATKTSRKKTQKTGTAGGESEPPAAAASRSAKHSGI